MNTSLPDITIEELVNEAIDLPLRQRFPEHLFNIITLHPEIVLELIPYFISVFDDDKRKESCLRLIGECLACIHYELDRKSSNAEPLIKELEKIVLNAYKSGQSGDVMALNEILYNSELPLSIEIDNTEINIENDKLPDIMPKLAEFLEQIRREHLIHNVFELHEFLMMNLFSMPLEMQLGIIEELATSNKAMPHELAVIMLLHSKEKIRRHIPEILESFASKKVFNRIDLRRLIVIRNWLPMTERSSIDHLIKSIKKERVEPASYTRSQVTAIGASQFDGAGAQAIIFEAKNNGKRMVGGFVVKIGVGIKDAWVKPKSAKGEFEHMCNEMGSQIKPVSEAYVNKAVNHFLHENETSDKIPSPYLLQIAEIFGAKNWVPEATAVEDEIERIAKKTNFIYRDKKEIDDSFNRMKEWKHQEDFIDHWFECGDVVEKAFDHEFENDTSTQSTKTKIMDAAFNAFILPGLEKWEVIFLFMCLRARSKSIDSPLWKDFLILADLASQRKKLKTNPVLRIIAEQSVATFMRRNFGFM